MPPLLHHNYVNPCVNVSGDATKCLIMISITKAAPHTCSYSKLIQNKRSSLKLEDPKLKRGEQHDYIVKEDMTTYMATAPTRDYSRVHSTSNGNISVCMFAWGVPFTARFPYICSHTDCTVTGKRCWYPLGFLVLWPSSPHIAGHSQRQTQNW